MKIDNPNEKKFAAFIDRDGTINFNVDNLSNLNDLTLIPNTAQAIALLNKFNIPALVITNQPVIARGLLDEKGVDEIHREINKRIYENKARIDGFYFCPHHPEANIKKYRILCKCRKPGIKMYKQAARDFKVDLTKSYVIGDSFRDIEAGKTLGTTTIGVGSNRVNFQNSKPDFFAKDLYEAVKLILKKEQLK